MKNFYTRIVCFVIITTAFFTQIQAQKLYGLTESAIYHYNLQDNIIINDFFDNGSAEMTPVNNMVLGDNV